MTLNHVYIQINKVMNYLQSIDANTSEYGKRLRNQQNIHNAYNTLDRLKDELIREHIRAKQKRNKGEN